VVETVVVLAGGSGPSGSAFAAVPPGAPVVAADSGAEHALARGLTIEVAVGDFDSISAEALAALERAGVRLERYPTGKDATDLELALGVALALGPRRILVLGGADGRLDHLLGLLLLLGADTYAGVELDAMVGGVAIHVVRRERVLRGSVGELVSLFALHGPAVGVATEGLAYPLRGESLLPGSTRGVSNVFEEAVVRITVERGVVLAIRPQASADG
jgi:thiamine pyrophosphokinase